jgi:quinoprotein glucose dehydrogenase
LSDYKIAAQISDGGGRMPAVSSLDSKEVWSLVKYLQTGHEDLNCAARSGKPAEKSTGAQDYAVLEEAYAFLDPDGYPAISHPWGTLNAIDVNTGQYAWKIPFGEYPKLVAQGLKDTGSENYGGPIVTAGGLLFIGATSFDKKFHAYDVRNGSLLWEAILPAPGNATPATYRANGRQFVVIAAGGGRPGKAESGSKIVAYALPD